MTALTEVDMTDDCPLDAPTLEKIQGLIGEIVNKASARGGACVYRGEPECYRVVSSGLYRKIPEGANEAFDMGQVEKETVESARQYTALSDDDEVLTEIQHFGGATNFIDFTDDFLIALFFASIENDGTDGRVVLHWPESGTVVRPKQTLNRVVSQKSLFIRPRRGFILPDARDETVIIPGGLKESVLTFLGRFHGISERTVFNDIHGFIRHQNPAHSGYPRKFQARLQKAVLGQLGWAMRLLDEGVLSIRLRNMRHAYHQRGMAYEDGSGSWYSVISRGESPHQTYDNGIQLEAYETVTFFTEVIERAAGAMPLEEAYRIRGEAHLYQGKADLAILDFEESLARYASNAQRSPNHDAYKVGMAAAYGGRGNARRHQGSKRQGINDLDEALRLQPGLPSASIDRGNASREDGSIDEVIRIFDQTTGSTGMGFCHDLAEPGDWFFYRAIALCIQKDWNGAARDVEAARRKGILVAASFRNICGEIETFEAEHGIRVPSFLATMLYVP